MEHENDDTGKLLLSKDKWQDIDVVTAVCCIESRRKIRTKLPSWYSQSKILYINTLSAEQCSSEATARYKASLAARLLEEAGKGRKIADLTGGLGVDSLAFSKVADSVLYNEANPKLHNATKENFKTLDADNILTANHMIYPLSDIGSHAGEASACTAKELLGNFRPDLIFLDPARRDNAGKKVFLLEDCSPDIVSLKDELLEIAGIIMVKLSPMADISMAVKRLGSHCREVHVISSAGECKELLIILDRDWNGEYSLTVNENGNILTFKPEDEVKASIRLSNGILAPGEVKYLFEPGKAMMKAGCFNLICSEFDMVKAAKSTHLYFTISKDKALAAGKFGKVYEIIDAEPFSNKSIKDFAQTYPGADVTVRNLPLSSDGLRLKMYGKGRSKTPRPQNIHIFAFDSDKEGKIILATTPSSHI